MEKDINSYYLHELAIKKDGTMFKTGTDKNGTSGIAASPLGILLQKLQNVNPQNKTNQSRVLDAEYMQAVKGGDMETAQRLVGEAAKAEFPNYNRRLSLQTMYKHEKRSLSTDAVDNTTAHVQNDRDQTSKNSLTDSSAKSNTQNKINQSRVLDAEYMQAVKSGDMETALWMIDEAAYVLFGIASNMNVDAYIIRFTVNSFTKCKGEKSFAMDRE